MAPRGATFIYADLTNADIQNSTVNGNFSAARLRDIEAFNANLSGSSFFMADLIGARLGGGGINLTDTNFVLANLSGVEFGHAYVGGSDFDAAAFRDTNLSRFRARDGEQPADLRNSFGDASVVLPEGPEPPCHWADEILSDEEFYARWRGWVEASPVQHDGWDRLPNDGWDDVAPIPPPAGCAWRE